MALRTEGSQSCDGASRSSSRRPALGFTAVAGAERRYTDTAGDSGSAPDLGQVVVSNDSGQVVFQVSVPARLPEPDELYALAIDSDANPATGEKGLEVRVIESGTSSYAEQWSGSAWVNAPSGGISVHLHLLGDTGLWIDVGDLGCRDGEDDVESDDPYTLAMGDVRVTPAVERSGKQITVKAPVRQAETRHAIATGTVRCTAEIGSATKRWAGRLIARTATCTLRAPKVSKPTSVKGSITVSSKSKTASAPFAVRAR